MKSVSLLLAAAALVAAQKAEDYFPECSIDCLEDSVSAVSECTFDDAWCICVQATYEAITAHGTSCVMKECGADVAVGDVLPAAIPYCEAATSSHEAGAKETDTPSATASGSTSSPAPESSTSAADDAEETGDVEGSEDADGDEEDSGAARGMPAIMGMLALGAVAAF